MIRFVLKSFLVSLSRPKHLLKAFKTVFFEHFDKKTAIQCISIDRSLSRKMVKYSVVSIHACIRRDREYLKKIIVANND